MLEMIAYRHYESMAKAALPNWQIAQRHNLDHFEMTGFPVRIATLGETRQLLDTMQENGFEKYQDDFGGLAPLDLDMLTRLCARLVTFQLTHYPDQPPMVPVDTAMAALCAWKRLTALGTPARSILEIGPGCGYLALLAADHAPLQNYSTVECCESFYLLQHYLNVFAFGDGFRQMAYPEGVSRHFIRADDGLAAGTLLTAGEGWPRKAYQYPWWRLRTLRERGERFDVIVANSNLLEFNPEALKDYLELFKDVLAEDGLVFIQGLGFETPDRNKGYLFKQLHERRLAPLFITSGPVTKDRAFWREHALGECSFIREGDARRFGSDFAVLITESHPFFTACYEAGSYRNAFVLAHPCLTGFFAPAPEDARRYTRSEVADAVRRRLSQAA
ncbi:hypothetical protein NNJEOMEG_02792 [Fundidesulfovibrio magnetotacticus]|uniref:Uncharacterized protein n=1 Tax=Fundidesulfovibrio magnetotacticus TaxID=2730080 RepID=A0A6V8LT93_9BACT|nr:hypothetical protein [Fundidesulfovibrio magnetotacticus]GFK94944.1 hypothetical protein NNJEOMEG_02792 [Fundidesulfovibrio magnetotacticus]